MCDPYPYGGCPVCDDDDRDPTDHEPDPDIYRDNQIAMGDYR